MSALGEGERGENSWRQAHGCVESTANLYTMARFTAEDDGDWEEWEWEPKTSKDRRESFSCKGVLGRVRRRGSW
jgi:hypothetical protein